MTPLDQARIAQLVAEKLKCMRELDKATGTKRTEERYADYAAGYEHALIDLSDCDGIEDALFGREPSASLRLVFGVMGSAKNEKEEVIDLRSNCRFTGTCSEESAKGMLATAMTVLSVCSKTLQDASKDSEKFRRDVTSMVDGMFPVIQRQFPIDFTIYRKD